MQLARNLPKEVYKSDEVQEMVSLVVVLILHHVWGIYVKISVARDMMRVGLVFAFGRQPWSYLLFRCLFNFEA